MVVVTVFNVGEEVIANINDVFYKTIIEAINININNINVITNRYEVCYKNSITNRIESTIVTEDKLIKIINYETNRT